MKFNIMLLLSLASFSLYALEDYDRQQIIERIKPVGRVHVIYEQNDSNKKPVVTVKKEEKKEAGQATYEQYCITCHRDGVAGAPKFRDAEEWKSRLTGKSIDDLVAIAIKGLNAMPAKGTCMECSEAEIKDAIQYMLPKS